MTTHNNTAENLDELRKRAIEKLFEEAEYKPARIYSLAERLADYATLNARGDVFIKRKVAGLPDKYKVGLVVAARFIAHALRDEIEEIVSIDDVEKYAEIDKKIVAARLSDLRKEGYIERKGKGKYKWLTYSKLEHFLTDIEKRLRGER